MQIGLFPGSFNPIHLGHLIMAQYFLNHFLLDQVWFVISPQNPLKKKSLLAGSEHRLKMVQLSIGDSTQLMASDIELHLPLPSFTIDTLDHLKTLYPDRVFSLILGLDNYTVFNKWKSHERLIQENNIYLYPRLGYEIPHTFSSPNFILAPAPELGISSTDIRNCIKSGKSIRFMVMEPVLDYITKNHLYS